MVVSLCSSSHVNQQLSNMPYFSSGADGNGGLVIFSDTPFRKPDI